MNGRKKAQNAQKKKTTDASDVRVGLNGCRVQSRVDPVRFGLLVRWFLPVSAFALFAPFCGYLCSNASAQEVPEEFGNPWMANLVELESPPPVPWWPPAPGWYVLAALILLIGLSVAWRAFRRWRANAYRREGLRLVRASASKPSGAALDTIAGVLKRVAMQTYGRSRVAQLAGRQWLEFLDRTGRTSAFSNGVGQRLTDARYSSNSDQVDPAKLKTVIDVAATWIRRHRPAAEPKR